MLIAIDPGPSEHGIVWFDGTRVVRAENLTTELAINEAFDSGFPVACEMVECFGMPVGREVFETVMQIGRMHQVLRWMRLIPRRDVKMHLCGNCNKAKDSNIRQALIDKLGPVGTKRAPGPCYGVSNHLWAALAVAVTAYELEQTKNEWYARKHQGV
jgi:hypothetical protein